MTDESIAPQQRNSLGAAGQAMNTAIPIEQRGKRIQSLADWETIAPPKSKHVHWQDGRSAKELARAWTRLPIGPTPPDEFSCLLKAHPVFKDVRILSGRPEDRCRFDEWPGEPRNADLNLLCEIPKGAIVISVEAKADESFGTTVAQVIAAATKRIADGKRSNGKQRAQALVERLIPLGTRTPRELPYQLLAATAGLLSLAAMHHAVAALLLIHEFVNGRRSNGRNATRASKVRANAARLDAFVAALSRGAVPSLVSGSIVGPFITGWGGVPLHIGKLQTDLAAPN